MHFCPGAVHWQDGGTERVAAVTLSSGEVRTAPTRVTCTGRFPRTFYVVFINVAVSATHRRSEKRVVGLARQGEHRNETRDRSGARNLQRESAVSRAK